MKNPQNKIKDEEIQISDTENVPNEIIDKEQDGLLLVRLYLNNLEQVACARF